MAHSQCYHKAHSITTKLTASITIKRQAVTMDAGLCKIFHHFQRIIISQVTKMRSVVKNITNILCILDRASLW